MTAVATEIVRECTAASVSHRGVDTNRRNPPPNLQDRVHRANQGGGLRRSLIIVRDVQGRGANRPSAGAHLVDSQLRAANEQRPDL